MISRTINKMQRGKVLQRGGSAIFAFTARSLQQLSTLIITLLAARFLPVAEFGIYALGAVFMMLIQTMTYTGFYHFVVTSKEADDEVLPTSFWMITGLSLAAAAFFCALAYPLEWLFETPGLALVVILLVLAQPVSSFSAWASAVMLRRRKVQTNFNIMFWQNLGALIGGVLLMTYWHSLYALVAFRYLRALIGIALYVGAGIRIPALRFNKELGRTATIFSSHLYGSRFLAFLAKYAGDLMLGIYFSVAEVGLYRFGNRLAGSATDVLIQPMNNFAITQMGAAGRAGRPLDEPVRRFAGTVTLMTGIVGAGIIVFGHDVLSNFFNETYLAALVVTYAMAVRGVVSAGQAMLEAFFSAVGDTSWVTRFNFFSAIVSVGAIVVTAPFGLEVLAWGQAAVVFITTMRAFHLMQSKGGIKVGNSVKGFLLACGLAGAYGLTVWFVHRQVLPGFGLEGMVHMFTGIGIAALLAPVLLLIGWRMRVFTLSVFSG